jgi:hypothetical protein
MASGLLASRRSRELGLIALNFLSTETNLRAQSAHSQRRARAEIDRLLQRLASHEAFVYAPGGSRCLRSLRPTSERLEDPAFRIREPGVGDTFALDLSAAI